MAKINRSKFDTTFLNDYYKPESDNPKVKNVNKLISKVQGSKKLDQLLGLLNNLSKELDIGDIDKEQFYSTLNVHVTEVKCEKYYTSRTSEYESYTYDDLNIVKGKLTTLITEVKKSIQESKTDSDSK